MTFNEAEARVKELTDEIYRIIESVENPNDITISIVTSVGYKNYRMYDRIDKTIKDVFGHTEIDLEKIRV